jgi:hypothetical protein
VADEVDLAAEAIDQGEGVGGEGVEVVGTDDRRGGVAAQPWRDDAVVSARCSRNGTAVGG